MNLQLNGQFQAHDMLMTSCNKHKAKYVINNIEERKMTWRNIMKTCKLYLPIIRTLGITRITNFDQADYTCYHVCCYYFTN